MEFDQDSADPLLTDSEYQSKIDSQYEEATSAFIAVSIQMPSHPEGLKAFVVSSFVVDIDGLWWLISAEHAFLGDGDTSPLDKIIAQFPDTRLCLQPFSDSAKPSWTFFQLDTERYFNTARIAQTSADVISQEDFELISDLDLIAIPLSEYYKANLKSCGVRPFQWNQIKQVDESEAAEALKSKNYSVVLMGVPSNSIETYDTQYLVHLNKYPFLPVEYDHPFSIWEPGWEREAVSYDLRGTSGGPVLLLGLDQSYLIGIQTSQIVKGSKYKYKAVNAFFLFEYIKSLQKSLGLIEAN